MTQVSSQAALKQLRLMLAFFGEATTPLAQMVQPEDMPDVARHLLVHHGHMTEQLEAHYQTTVDVYPYAIHRSGDIYGRKLDLKARRTADVVMTGLMIFNLQAVAPHVRAEILDAQLPLGRILINHGVLREVHSEAYLRIDGADPMARRLLRPGEPAAYGRLATIWCDGQPAVDLLEVVQA